MFEIVIRMRNARVVDFTTCMQLFRSKGTDRFEQRIPLTGSRDTNESLLDEGRQVVECSPAVIVAVAHALECLECPAFVKYRQSPEQALRSLGYTDPWDCMQLKGGTLASPEQIKAQRSKLEESMVSIHGQACQLEAQEGF